MSKKIKVVSIIVAMILCVSLISPRFSITSQFIHAEGNGTEQKPLDNQQNGVLAKNDISDEVVISNEKSANPESDFDFNSISGEITKYKGSSRDVIIPDTINGVPVVKIGETAFNFTRYGKPIDNIQLPNTLKVIGDMAFQNQKFKTINFPEGLESIGETAFLNCLDLEEVVLPDSVTTLGRAAFKQCPGIRKIVLSSNLKIIPSDCFYPTNQVGSLEEVVFKEGLEEIGNSAFMGQKLKNINLPDSLKIIDKQAFAMQQEKQNHGTIYVGNSIQEIRAANVGNISNAFGGWNGYIIFPFTKEEAAARGVNAVLTYPGNNFKLGYSNIVKYELNGGTPAIQDEVVSYGEVIKNRPENMDKVGYTFAGWYKENTFLTLWNFANDKVTTNITLYAKWNPKAYTVIYDTQGASAIADKTDVHFNDKELLPATEPKKSGYEFKGWKMGDKEINNQTTYESLVTDDTQMNITLTAQWNPKVYTVTYDTQGADTIADKTDVHFNDKELLPAIEPKKSGYEFKGWKMGDKEINNQTTYESLVTDDTQMNITLTAQWKIVKSTVSNHVNNQSNSNMPSTGDKTNVVLLIILILFTSLLLLFGMRRFCKNLLSK